MEGVAPQAPAALVDAVGQPERAQVGIGADVGAVGLDVVGRVGHHHELVADDVEHPAGELGAARPAGEDDHHGVSTPVILIPACALWRTLIEISSAVSDSTMRAISRRPASTQRRPSMRSMSAMTRSLSSRWLPQTSTSSSSACSRSPHVGGADGVQRADHAHAVGHHLLGLLGGGALPHAEHARGAAADGGGQRHRRVDHELVLAQRALEVGQRLGLVAEGDAEHDDLGLRGRLGVLIALEMAVGQGRAGALGGLDGAGGIARAQDDGDAGAAPAQRQAEAERAGGADDRNGLGQGRRVYVQVQVTQLPQSVRIREVGPRDGFQNEPEVIATDDKVRLIDALMRTGLRRIEATSFVRADVIPQLADAERGAGARSTARATSRSRC